MTWNKINEYYYENNGWTIDKHGDSRTHPKFPYGLWNGAKNHGYFTTAKEAIAKHKELTGQL